MWKYRNGGWECEAAAWDSYCSINNNTSPKCPGCGEILVPNLDPNYAGNGTWRKNDNVYEAKHSCGTLIRYVS